jgi:hypothetical protein
MLDQTFGRDPGHNVICVVNPSPTVIAERDGQGLGDFIRSGGA